MKGHFLDKNALYMHVHIGHAEGEKGEYELLYSMHGTPIIKSQTTGNYFTLTWEDILALAQEAGIDEETP